MISCRSSGRSMLVASALLGGFAFGSCAPAAPGGGSALPSPPAPDVVGGGGEPSEGTLASEPPDAAPGGADAWVYAPHAVDGPRANCVACHAVSTGRNPMPADHAAYEVGTCVSCHPARPPG